MMARVIKSSGLVLLALVVVASGFFPAVTEKVSASHDVPHSCAVPPNDPVVLYGRDELCGYFLNRAYLETGGVDGVGLLTGLPQPCTNPWQDALLGVNNVDQLVCAIHFNLLLPGIFRPTNGCNSPSGGIEDQRRNAASFIVLTMLGFGAGTPANHACNVFPTWEARVRQYAAAGLINFNHNRSYQQNTMIHTAFQDPLWYHNSTISHIAGDTRWTNSITFTAPNGAILYSIKKDCANPIGIPGSLPNLAHNFDATPNANVTVSPGADDPQTATFVGGATYSGAPFRATISRRDFILRSGSPTEETIALVSQTRTFSGSSYTFDDTRNLTGLNLEAGDRVCARTSIAPAAGTAGPDGTVISVSVGSRSSPSSCITVVDRPYFRTFGGDVSAGAGQDPSCRVDTNAAIIGLTNATYTGTGSQLAQFALGAIIDVASSQLRGGASPPNELAFANTAHDSPGGDPWAGNYGTFGGGLAPGNAACAQDFWEGASNIRPDNHAIGSLNLGTGQRETIYVDGDVFINGNITYAPGNFNSIEQIPAFRVIARGNIYVAPGVTELNGLFVAIPRNQASPTDGRFYTCWPGHIPTAADINGTCRSNRLLVYGAVIAEQIKLTRSSGSVRSSHPAENYDGLGFFAGTAAERFIYTPEVWLTSELNSGASELDSLVTLPPVL